MLPEFSASEMVYLRKKKGPGDWKQMEKLLNKIFITPKGRASAFNARSMLLTIRLTKIINKEERLCCLLSLCEHMLTDILTDQKYITDKYRDIINAFKSEHKNYEEVQLSIVNRLRIMRNFLLNKWIRLKKVVKRIEDESVNEEWEYVITYPIRGAEQHLKNLNNVLPTLLLSTPLYLVFQEILNTNFDRETLNATSHRNEDNLSDMEKQILSNLIISIYYKADFSDINIDSLRTQSDKNYKIISNINAKKKLEAEESDRSFIETIRREEEKNRQIAIRTIKKIHELLKKEAQYVTTNIKYKPLKLDVDKLAKTNTDKVYLLLYTYFSEDTLIDSSLIKYRSKLKKINITTLYYESEIYYTIEDARKIIEQLREGQNKRKDKKYLMCKVLALDVSALKENERRKESLYHQIKAEQMGNHVDLYTPLNERKNRNNCRLIIGKHKLVTIDSYTNTIEFESLLNEHIGDISLINTIPMYSKSKRNNYYEFSKYIRTVIISQINDVISKSFCKIKSGNYHLTTYVNPVTGITEIVQLLSADTLTEKEWNDSFTYKELNSFAKIKTCCKQKNYHLFKSGYDTTTPTWSVYIWSNAVCADNPDINVIELRLDV